MSSFSPPGSNFSFTISSLKTTPNAANNARLSVQTEVRASVLRRAPDARRAARRRRYHFVPRKAGRCSAGPASRKRRPDRLGKLPLFSTKARCFN
jgi:hypothetical protein